MISHACIYYKLSIPLKDLMMKKRSRCYKLLWLAPHTRATKIAFAKRRERKEKEKIPRIVHWQNSDITRTYLHVSRSLTRRLIEDVFLQYKIMDNLNSIFIITKIFSYQKVYLQIFNFSYSTSYIFLDDYQIRTLKDKFSEFYDNYLCLFILYLDLSFKVWLLKHIHVSRDLLYVSSTRCICIYV